MAVSERTGFIHKRVLSIIAFALSLVYVLYCVVYWSMVVAQAGVIGALAFNIILPHLICVGLGFVFTTLALFLGKPGWSLAAGIVYVLAIACFPGYWWCIIIQAVLSFIAFFLMRKDAKAREAALEADVAAEVKADSIDDGDPADAWKDAQKAKAAAGAPVAPVEARGQKSAIELAEEAATGMETTPEGAPVADGSELVTDEDFTAGDPGSFETPEGATAAGADDASDAESTTA